MMRNLKALGLALVAVFAMSAVAASAAQAEHKFTSESTTTYLLGEQKTKNVFTTSGGTVECTGAKFEGGPFSGTELKSVTIHPTYTGCTAFGLNATVETTGCNYIIEAAGKEEMGTAKVECEEGKLIRIKPLGCEVTVGPQTPTTPTVSFTNESTGKTADVLVTAEVGGITYTSSGFPCGPSGTNGTYTGSVTTKGYSDSAHKTQVGIKFDKE
jgi:hypothetical protein